MLDFYHYSTGNPPCTVKLFVTKTSGGLIIQLLGGERPHVGATIITRPRPSLSNTDLVSCNSVVIPEMGHKEDDLAKPLAEKIAVELNVTVVMIAGIHVDNAGPDKINYIKSICWQLVEEFLSST